jgi:hypothetical protein
MRTKLCGFALAVIGLLLLVLVQERGYAQGPRSGTDCASCVGNLSHGQDTYVINGCQITVMFSYSLTGCNKPFIEIDSIELGSGCGTIQYTNFVLALIRQILLDNPMGFPSPPAGGDCMPVLISTPRCSDPNADWTFGVHVCKWCCGEFDICVSAQGVREVFFANATVWGNDCNDNGCTRFWCPWEL